MKRYYKSKNFHEDLTFSIVKNVKRSLLFLLILSTIHVSSIYHTFSRPLTRVDKSELCTQRVAQKRRSGHLSWLAHEIKPFKYLSLQ